MNKDIEKELFDSGDFSLLDNFIKVQDNNKYEGLDTFFINLDHIKIIFNVRKKDNGWSVALTFTDCKETTWVLLDENNLKKMLNYYNKK